MCAEPHWWVLFAGAGANVAEPVTVQRRQLLGPNGRCATRGHTARWWHDAGSSGTPAFVQLAENFDGTGVWFRGIYVGFSEPLVVPAIYPLPETFRIVPPASGVNSWYLLLEVS